MRDPWRRAIHPMPHSCARMVATPMTHYSAFQNRSEQNSSLQRRPRCLRWKHSLLPNEWRVEDDEYVLLQHAAMPMDEKTTCTFNITTKEKLSFGASNVSLKNRCHGILLNKKFDINKFPLVLSTLFRTVTECKETDVVSSNGREWWWRRYDCTHRCHCGERWWCSVLFWTP